METFSALLAICAGNSPVPGEFHTQRPVTRSFDVYFDLRPNKRLSKQYRGWWFETLSPPLWRHRNVSTPCEIALRWTPKNLSKATTTRVQIMAGCLMTHDMKIQSSGLVAGSFFELHRRQLSITLFWKHRPYFTPFGSSDKCSLRHLVCPNMGTFHRPFDVDFRSTYSLAVWLIVIL